MAPIWKDFRLKYLNTEQNIEMDKIYLQQYVTRTAAMIQKIKTKHKTCCDQYFHMYPCLDELHVKD